MRTSSIDVRHRFLSWWKYCLSARKSNWSLGDYPVVIREFKPNPNRDDTPGKEFRYAALILGWGLAGGGDSEEEAIQALKRHFATAKAERAKEGKPLPRPGTRPPTELASQERVSAHPELAEDFIRRILNLEWAWISDESSLWDFHNNGTNDVLVVKIKELYDVDVSDIHSANLSEILERIAAQGKNKPRGYV